MAATHSELKDNGMLLNMEHLNELNYDMEVRFPDLLDMDIPGWIEDPFVVNAADVDLTWQEPLIELQNDIRSPSKL